MAEEVPRDKLKWTVNCKVYTRRARKTTPNPSPNPDPNPDLNPNPNPDLNPNPDDGVKNNREEVDGVVENNNDVEKGVEKDDGEEKASSSKGLGEEGILVGPQLNSPRLETVLVDSSSLSFPEAAVSSGIVENNNDIDKVGEKDDKEDEKVSSSKGMGEEGNLEEPQLNSPRLETALVDSSILSQPEAAVSIGIVENNNDVDKVGEEDQKKASASKGSGEEVNLVEHRLNSPRLETVSVDSSSLSRPEVAVSIGIVEKNNDVEKVGEKDDEEDEKVLPSKGMDEEGNLEEPQLNSPRLETVSVDSSSLSRPEAAVSNGVVENNNNAEKVGEEDKENLLPSKEMNEEGNLAEPQENSHRLEAISIDSSSLSRPEAAVSNGVGDEGVGGGEGEGDGSVANGLGRLMVKRVDDRVSISVSNSSSKPEVRELKRKLVSELDQIRKMAKRLEVKEVQLSGYSNSGVDIGFDRPAGGNFPYFANGVEKGLGGGTRVSSEMGSIGFDNSRPSRHGSFGFDSPRPSKPSSEMGSFGFDNSRPSRQLMVSVMDNNHGIGEAFDKEKRTPKANQFYRNSEFLLGKEKLPPAESNKKSKSGGGKKHRGGRELDYGFGIDKQLLKHCSSLLQKLISHKHGWIFKEPVDVNKLGLHDYFDIIKHPMDLGTVKSRLSNNWYKTPREFAEDVRLTFHNAMRYNPEGQDVHVIAKDLLRIFEDKWMSIETEYERKLRYEMTHNVGMPTPTSRKTFAPANIPSPRSFPPPPLLHNPPSFKETRYLERSKSMPVPPESRSKPVSYVARTPAPKKPKAKDPNKRDMTFDEKQKLSTNLQSLPTDKLDAIVQIIKKRNSALSQHDDEIEVDIDSVDTETLWELDRFVTNYKKNLSKRKRKAEIAQERAAALAQAVAADVQSVPEIIPAPANVEPATENRQDQGNGATPQAQPERHNENASDSSSSSSSSSDSGSSSSDSNSDSSSDSDSDGGD